MRKPIGRWLPLEIGASVLLLGVAECRLTPDDRALVRSFHRELARVKGNLPAEGAGRLAAGAILNLALTMASLSTGDVEVDAALDSLPVIKEIYEADKLMAEARQKRDASLMDEAIGMRPDDWTYRLARAGLALEKDDLDTAAEESALAYRLAGMLEVSPVRVWSELIQEYETARRNLGPAVWKSPERCRYLFRWLRDTHDARAHETGSKADMAMVQEYNAHFEECGE